MLNKPMPRRVGMVSTGAGNIASLWVALQRAGGAPYIVGTPDALLAADYLVVPGVGAFGPVVAALRQSGMLDALKARVIDDRPTLGICVGMQLLFAASEESPGTAGIGILPANVVALRAGASARPRAHFGWARIGKQDAAGFAYFAHSYAALNAPDDWQTKLTATEPQFLAEIRRGAVMGCQYHPEISGRYGANLLKSWLWGETPNG